MANIRIDPGSPAPKGYRKFENGFFMFLAPTITAVIQGWGFEDQLMTIRANLIAVVTLGALIKFVGYLIANGEVYAPSDKPETPQP